MNSRITVSALFYGNPDTYPPIVNSTRLLAESGLTVVLECRETNEHWGVRYPVEVQINRVSTPGSGAWREYFRFIAHCLASHSGASEVYIGHDMHGLLPARLLATRYRRPLVYYCHDLNDRSMPIQLGGRIVRTFEQRFARTADLVIAPDEERGAVIESTLHLKHPPLVVANAPIARVRSSGEALHTALAARGKSFDRVVLRQGRIGFGHGIEMTVRSLPAWTDATWGFVVMGPGEAGYIEYLERLAAELDVENRFVVLPPVSYDAVPSFTAGADLGHALYDPIHVNNVHVTTASNKIMEYMAAGLPLLLSDSPSLRAFADRYKSGAVVDSNTPTDIANGINRLLGDAEGLRRMSEAGVRAFDTTFSFGSQFAPALHAIKGLRGNN